MRLDFKSAVKSFADGHISNGAVAVKAPSTCDDWIDDVFSLVKLLKNGAVASLPNIGLISYGCKIRRRFLGNFDLEFRFRILEKLKYYQKFME